MSEKFYPVSISFACNDEHGNFTGVATAIEIGDVLSLDHNYWNPTKPRIDFKIEKTLSSGGFAASKVIGTVKLSRRSFPIVGYKGHWGNIIWDLVIVDIPTAQRIVEYLQTLDCFSPNNAFQNWWDKFNSMPFQWTDEEIEDLKKYGYQRP